MLVVMTMSEPNPQKRKKKRINTKQKVTILEEVWKLYG